MSRFLATLPVNLGFVNLGTVEAYPTGGTGPTAYGPTSYYGSDPLPSRLGDSVNNPINLGNLTPIYKSVTIKNTHGGTSRQQTSFYSFKLLRSRSIKLTQNYSQFSTTENTNRNTLVAFYKLTDGTHRQELPINDSGYVVDEASIEDGDLDNPFLYRDYPNLQLPPGEYIFLITNDIRYLETNYSITLESFLNDWRFVAESIDEALNFDLVTEGSASFIDFGLVTG
jgi:hypothetical protein